MSNESTATKWILGCLAFGLLGLFACGGLVAWIVGATMRAGQEMAEAMNQQRQVMQQASNWDLPGDWTAPDTESPDELLLPLQVGNWERSFTTTETTIPVINIDRETASAVYAAEGSTLDVYVSRVSFDEQDAVFEQAEAAITDSDGGHTTIGSDNGTTRTFFFQTWGVNGDQGSGWLVWNGGWLFLIHATDIEAPIGEFMSAYFSGIDANHSHGESIDSIPEFDGLNSDPAAQPLPGDEETDSADARLSPFTEVVCQPDDAVLVRIDDEERMLQLVSIDDIPTAEIIATSRNTYQDLWEKRFVEDIVEVLAARGHSTGETVKLVLRDPESGATRTIDEAPMTEENRRRVYAARYPDE